MFTKRTRTLNHNQIAWLISRSSLFCLLLLYIIGGIFFQMTGTKLALAGYGCSIFVYVIFLGPSAKEWRGLMVSALLLALVFAAVEIGWKRDLAGFLETSMVLGGVMAFACLARPLISPSEIVLLFWSIVIVSAYNLFKSGAPLSFLLGSLRGGNYVSFGISPLSTHHFMGAICAITFLAVFFHPTRRRTLDTVSTLLLAFTFLILSGARTHLVFCIVATIFGVAVQMSRSRIVRIAIALSVVVLLPLLFIAGNAGESMQSSFLERTGLVRLNEATKNNTLTSGRDNLWRHNLSLFVEKPFFGNRAEVVRVVPEKNWNGVVENRTYFGEKITAANESYFDYLLARHGLLAVFFFAPWVAVLCLAAARHATGTFVLVCFGFLASAFQPILRLTYNIEALIYGVLIFSFAYAEFAQARLDGSLNDQS